MCLPTLPPEVVFHHELPVASAIMGADGAKMSGMHLAW
jgi:hypothetical protein